MFLNIYQADNIIVSFFQQNEKANKFFDDENLTEVVRNLFTAGMDTTATTLRWGLLLMMKYPEIQSKWKLGIQWLSSHRDSKFSLSHYS